jgi:biopolymer transport protein TolR
MDIGDKNDNEINLVSNINITPLVDVMLVLLIIFMVTASMGQQGVKVNLPKTNKAKTLVVPEQMVVVSLDKNLKIYINDIEIQRDSFESKLREIYKNRTNREIFVKADQDVSYGEFAKIISLIKFVGIEKLGMITEPQPKEKKKT